MTLLATPRAGAPAPRRGCLSGFETLKTAEAVETTQPAFRSNRRVAAGTITRGTVTGAVMPLAPVSPLCSRLGEAFAPAIRHGGQPTSATDDPHGAEAYNPASARQQEGPTQTSRSFRASDSARNACPAKRDGQGNRRNSPKSDALSTELRARGIGRSTLGPAS